MAREMKDSGIEWIGFIPYDWTLPKLLYVLREKICDGPHETPTYVDDGIPFISIDSLNDTRNIDFSVVKKFISEKDYNSYSIKTKIEEGDILFSKAATIGKTAIVGNEKFMVWSPLAVIKSNENIVINEFLYYLLNCPDLINSIALSGSVNTQINVGMRELEQARIPLPPIEEQIVISHLIDTEFARIDTLMEQTQASIEEYKKLKQALITQAVTKGIRPNRPMKDSGIDWIGDIPYDWNVVNAHRIIISTQNGLTRRDLEQSTGHIVLKLKNISPEGVIDYSFINRIQLSNEELEKYSLQDGDFLFVRVNGSKALVGKCAIFHSIDEPVAYNDHIIRVKLSKIIDLYYFQYYLLSNWGRKEIDLRTSTAAGQYTISGESLRDIVVMLPAIEEQKEIVLYLSKVCSIIDCLINKKESLISELENYKKSIIYEYVTGKKEVPL